MENLLYFLCLILLCMSSLIWLLFKERWQSESRIRKLEGTIRTLHIEKEFWYGRYKEELELRLGNRTKGTMTISNAKLSLGLTDSAIKKMLVLCHPDKHANSQTSTEVTQWLLRIREK